MMQETTSHAVYTDPSSVARNWHGTNIQDLRLMLLAVSANMSLPALPTPPHPLPSNVPIQTNLSHTHLTLFPCQQHAQVPTTLS